MSPNPEPTVFHGQAGDGLYWVFIPTMDIQISRPTLEEAERLARDDFIEEYRTGNFPPSVLSPVALAREKRSGPGQWHAFCGWCNRPGNRLALTECRDKICSGDPSAETRWSHRAACGDCYCLEIRTEDGFMPAPRDRFPPNTYWNPRVVRRLRGSELRRALREAENESPATGTALWFLGPDKDVGISLKDQLKMAGLGARSLVRRERYDPQRLREHTLPQALGGYYGCTLFSCPVCRRLSVVLS